MSNKYEGKVVDILEDGSAIISIPEELLEEAGWFEGDLLIFDMLDDGSIITNCNLEYNNAVNEDYQKG